MTFEEEYEYLCRISERIIDHISDWIDFRESKKDRFAESICISCNGASIKLKTIIDNKELEVQRIKNKVRERNPERKKERETKSLKQKQNEARILEMEMEDRKELTRLIEEQEKKIAAFHERFSADGCTECQKSNLRVLKKKLKKLKNHLKNLQS